MQIIRTAHAAQALSYNACCVMLQSTRLTRMSTAARGDYTTKSRGMEDGARRMCTYTVT